MLDFPVDFVVDWVDGSDPEWIENRNRYTNNKEDKADVRFRDWDLLKYWFRAVEVNAPWVNKIYFVTCGQKPEWLNEKNPKLVLVDHEDYIPKQYLPTFNSNAIELPINKIAGLSEYFVFFNDDFYLNSKVDKSDFFDSSGVPLDSGVLSPQIPIQNSITHITTNNIQIINKYFSRNDVLKNFFKFFNIAYGKQNVKTIATLPWKQILGFHDFHIPISFQKSTFDSVWSMENDILRKTLEKRFRSNDDLNIWLFRYYQLLTGNFKPRNVNFGKYYNLSDNNELIIKDIEKSFHNLIVLNDQEKIENFKKSKKELVAAFNYKYPLKSRFEK